MQRAPSALRFSLAAVMLTLACAVARGEEPLAPTTGNQTTASETTGSQTTGGQTSGSQTTGSQTIGSPEFLNPFKDSITTMPDASDLTTKATIYVPAYSRVYGASAGAHKLLALSTTLRIDNTSATKPLVIESIEYYETSGKLVQSYLSEPLALRPFGTLEIVIPAEDDRGGVAANFIVRWAGSGPIAEPMVEAVMIGSQDNTSYSFVSPGRTIRHVGRSAWPQFRFRF
jgi:hypothetical protein